MKYRQINEGTIKDGDRILIMKPSSLGDIVHTVPVVQAIKRQFPRSRISWFVLREYLGLVDLLDDVDETIPFFRHGITASPVNYVKSQLETIRNLRKGSFDWVLDFQGLFRSALFGYLSGARRKFGFSWKREPNKFFYNFYVNVDRRKHALERNLGLAACLGIKVSEKDLVARFKIKEIRGINLGKEGRVIICPGGRWRSKRWPIENYASVAKYVVEKLKKKVVVVGSREERGLGEFIAERVGKGVLDLTGRISLEELPSVLQGAEIVVTNDTGPMHLAAAMGKRILAFFGPTDPARTGPYGKNHVVLTSGVKCAPCFKKECDKGTECLKTITVERATFEVKELLGVN